MNARITWRMTLIMIVLVAWILTSCSSIEINRNAPLLQSEITVQDSANGNTVPLAGP